MENILLTRMLNAKIAPQDTGALAEKTANRGARTNARKVNTRKRKPVSA